MTRCLDCHRLTKRGSRCPACARFHQSQRNQQRGGSGWAWQATRTRIIERDRACVMPAPHDGPLRVDHVVPLHHGGTNEDANLRTLCLFHHQGVTKGGGG